MRLDSQQKRAQMRATASAGTGSSYGVGYGMGGPSHGNTSKGMGLAATYG